MTKSAARADFLSREAGARGDDFFISAIFREFIYRAGRVGKNEMSDDTDTFAQVLPSQGYRLPYTRSSLFLTAAAAYTIYIHSRSALRHARPILRCQVVKYRGGRGVEGENHLDSREATRFRALRTVSCFGPSISSCSVISMLDGDFDGECGVHLNLSKVNIHSPTLKTQYVAIISHFS